MPMQQCENGCVRCKECLIKLQKSNTPCPTHNSPVLHKLIKVSGLLDMVESELGQLWNVDNIQPEMLDIKPYVKNYFADVYITTYERRECVVKVPKAIESSSWDDGEMKRFRLEANLASGMNNDNIVRILGLTILNDKRLGIVMMMADNGSLENWLRKFLWLLDRLDVHSEIEKIIAEFYIKSKLNRVEFRILLKLSSCSSDW